MDFLNFLQNNWIYIAIGAAALVIFIIIITACVKHSKRKKKTLKQSKTQTPSQSQTQTQETTIATTSEKSTPTYKTKKYMVTYDKLAGEWLVKNTANSRVSRRCKTKKEALEFANQFSKTQNLHMTVLKRNGKFQKKSKNKK